ncbi:MAG TPA: alpha/beta hydrolase [Verrucomicrobiae bacterium]
MPEEKVSADESVRIRIHDSLTLPTLIYLPGTHGDWSVITGLRNKLIPQFCFVEITYPRTVTWTLADYAEHIRKALKENGITRGWLLGESFGSQVAWLLANETDTGFQCQGIILAGGFGRHPLPWAVSMASKGFTRFMADEGRVRRAMKNYARYVHRFYEQTPETASSVEMFIQRRTPEDAQAAVHRLRLIQGHAPAELVRRTQVPVFSLSGVWDQLVPWFVVTPWLKCHCPGYRDSKLILKADHNVLFSAPTKSARTIQEWLGRVG